MKHFKFCRNTKESFGEDFIGLILHNEHLSRKLHIFPRDAGWTGPLGRNEKTSQLQIALWLIILSFWFQYYNCNIKITGTDSCCWRFSLRYKEEDAITIQRFQEPAIIWTLLEIRKWDYLETPEILKMLLKWANMHSTFSYLPLVFL